MLGIPIQSDVKGVHPQSRPGRETGLNRHIACDTSVRTDPVKNLPNDDGRSEERFALPTEQLAKVAVVRGDDLQPKTIHGQLLELSCSGVKIQLPTSLGFEETVELHISIDNLNVQTVVTAKVCWARPMDASSWLLGCSLQDDIPATALDHFASGGYIDRRDSERCRLVYPAVARWELQNSGVSVQIRDFSTGGFCFWCLEPEAQKLRVVLQIKKPEGTVAIIRGKECWRHHTQNGGCFIGCSFLDRSDFWLFVDIACAVDPNHVDRDSPVLHVR